MGGNEVEAQGKSWDQKAKSVSPRREVLGDRGGGWDGPFGLWGLRVCPFLFVLPHGSRPGVLKLACFVIPLRRGTWPP